MVQKTEQPEMESPHPSPEQMGNEPTQLEAMVAVRKMWNALPRLDERSAEEILGYDENGLPT